MRPRLRVVVPAFLLALCLGADGVGGGFVYDDHLIVERNARLDGIGSIPALALQPYWGDLFPLTIYRPLTLASFAVEVSIAGRDSPAIFHVTNALLYAVAAALVSLLALQLGVPGPGAMAAGLLFAAHPVHTEAVANVVGRSELGAGIFVMLALVVEARRRAGWGEALFCGLCVFGALGFKESGIAALAGIAWLALLAGKAEWRSRWRTWITSASALVLWLALRAAALREIAVEMPVRMLDNPLAVRDASGRVAGALALTLRSLRMTAWPWPLSADYSFDALRTPSSLLSVGALAGLLIWLGGAGLATWLATRRPIPAWRSMSLAIVLFLAALLPVSNLLFPIGTSFAERVLFIPSIGLCLVLGSLYRKQALIPLILVLAIGSAAFVKRTLEWKDDMTISQAIIRVQPRSAKGWSKVGWEAYKAGDLASARTHLGKAIEIYPDYIDAHASLALTLAASDDLDGAVTEAQHAVALAPDYARARDVLRASLLALAARREQQGDLTEAQRLRADAARRLGAPSN
jgi:tetratricopeptide (TPR) repeat protein